MVRFDLGKIVLNLVFLILIVIAYLSRDWIYQAHIDETIKYLSSDGYVYFRAFDERFRNVDLAEDWYSLRRSSPAALLILAEGNLFAVQMLNLALMYLTMRTAIGSLSTNVGKMTFLFCSLVFPYYAFGFLSLNKEVYAMCSAIFFGIYLIRQKFVYFLISLLLAATARYFMIASILMLFLIIPRRKEPRFFLALMILVGISLVAPVIRGLVPDYTAENLTDTGGASSVFFDTIVQNYGYAFLYPFKYVMMMLLRPYGYLIGSTHDAIGAAVSALSFVAAGIVAWMWLGKRTLTPLVRRLAMAGVVAPIPIMWSEITHWRYYSFVYFFFLFAIILQREAERRQRRASSRGGTPSPSTAVPSLEPQR